MQIVNWKPQANCVGWLYPYSLTDNFVGTGAIVQDVRSDILPSISYNSLQELDTPGIALANDGVYGIAIMQANKALTTRKAISSYLSENPIQVVYKLAEPQTYQLTAEQVSGILETLYGTNNIWANTGDVEVTYPADTKLYIDGKLAEIQATILENIGG